MSKAFPRFLLFAVAALSTAASCDLASTEKSACDDTKWDTPLENTHRVYLRFDESTEFLPDGSPLVAAQSIGVTGTIWKQYCGGEVSGMFSFQAAPLPSTVQIDESIGVSDLYVYKIENDQDFIMVEYDLEIVSELGNKYVLDSFSYGNYRFSGEQLASHYYTLEYLVPSIVQHYELRLTVFASQLSSG